MNAVPVKNRMVTEMEEGTARAFVVNVEIQLRLRMDDNHSWFVNVAFVRETCRLEVN